jgi:D-alanine transaminase
MNSVFLNGQFIPRDQASIPVTDRGFLFGDGVYEVIPAYGGKPFRLAAHIQRLENSLTGIFMTLGKPLDEWQRLINELIRINQPDGDFSIYLQITRGTEETRQHRLPENIEPTVLMMLNPVMPSDEQTLLNGISAVTMEDIRWQYCHIKATSLLPNVLLYHLARQQGAQEAILVRDKHVTEGSSSNVFIVRNQQIKTPPKSDHLLPGITRDLVLDLAKQEKMPYVEEPLTLKELQRADEIWISSSTRELIAVTKLDSTPVGHGRAGPLWARLYAAIQRYKDRLRHG